MKKQIVLVSTLCIALAFLVGLSSCKKKSDSDPFSLSSLVAQLEGGSINLNGATSANNVPSDPVIVATFTMDVNAASLTTNSITLVRDYDQKSIPLTVTLAGNKITIIPDEELGNGALFKLTFPSISSTDGQSISGFFRTFTTIGTFVPVGQIAYWNFEGNANDQVGTFNADSVIAITYTPSYKASAGTAATFDGTTSIIEIPNGDQLSNTADMTLNFWMKTNSVGHVDADGNPKGHFVIGLGAYYGFQFELQGTYAECKLGATYNVGDPATNPHDLVFNGDGLTMDNGGWKACTYCKALTPTPAEGMVSVIKDKWISITFVFNGSTKKAQMYFNGELMKEEDFTLADPPLNAAAGLKWTGTAPDVYPRLAFGFIKSRQGTLWANQPWGGYTIPTSNHFGGQLDDVRIFHRVLTATEIDLMYQSEKP
ncbi:MAG: Ig-like domain-containing protein [Bacteroidales bacterium]|nr:Ig-like domain-containing protein [Bacteroidales bacterium]